MIYLTEPLPTHSLLHLPKRRKRRRERETNVFCVQQQMFTCGVFKLIEINNHFIFSSSFSGVALDVDRRRAEDVCCERL